MSVVKLLYTILGRTTGVLTVVIVAIAAVIYYIDDPHSVKYDR